MKVVDGVNCFTQSEAARALGCSRQNIKQCIQRKTIPSVLGPSGVLYVPYSYVVDTMNLRLKKSGVGT